MNHDDYMDMAIEEAIKSRLLKDYGIGCVIVRNGEVIARAGNRIRTEMDPSSHTEIVAMRMACRDLQSRYLQDCTLYSTHAPCAMCLGASVWAKIDKIVYGVSQQDITEYGNKYGNDKFKWRGTMIEPTELYDKYLQSAHPGMLIVPGVKRDECMELFHSE